MNKSKCCITGVTIGWDRTHYHICLNCNNACDVVWLVCIPCWVKHTNRKLEWNAITCKKWICDICKKETSVTSSRNY